MAETYSPPVRCTTTDAVATITLDQSAQLNALTTDAKRELLALLLAAAADDAIRAVVLTGSGRAFCAGQDLAEHANALAADPGAAFDTVTEHYNPIVASLAGMPKPVVAAINGVCAGAGIGFALACDYRVAARSAKFSAAFAGVGLTADSGLSWSLQRAVGASRASAMLMLGRPFGAEEAASTGVVHEVVDDIELESRATAVATQLANGPTLAFAAMKTALRRAASMSLEDTLAMEAQLQSGLALSSDHQSAVQAFMNKSRPQFEGR